MPMDEHPPGLYHPDLDQLLIPQSSAELVSDPDIWFVAVKLIQACIDQGQWDFSAFNDQISELDSQLATLNTVKSENKVLLEENTVANRTIANLRSRIEMLSTSPEPEKRQLSEKLPDPELFDGDKQKLRSWTYSLRVKLVGNADRYPSESSKMQYSVGRLTGKALDQVVPRVKKDGTIDFATVNDLITYLKVAFGDPDEKGTSQRELQELRQTNRAFSDYLADFRRIADRTGYDKEAKRAALLAGLSTEIQQALVVLDLLDSLEAAIVKIQKIDNKLRALNSRIPRNSASNTNSSQALPRPKPTNPSSSPSDVFSNPSGAPPATSPPLPGGDPIDLGIGRARGPLTPAERLRRINNSLCMYCGGANHYAGNFPKANRKTMLREMVVHGKQQSESLQISTKPTNPSTPLSSTSSENL